MTAQSNGSLRSQAWFGGTSRDVFIHRSWMRNQGLPDDVFDGRPVIGICNTFSELTPCNAHFRGLADKVKQGVLQAGGVAFEFPVMSLGESNLRPTAMLFRNLVSMDVEESIRGNPIDGVVLLTGCDKTTPALLMGAASCDLPSIVVSGGPMLNGRFKGVRIFGSGGLHVPKRRPLHDHGDSFHYGVDGRGARRGPASQRRDPCRRFQTGRPGTNGRAPHRRDGAGGSATLQSSHPRSL